MMNYQAIQNIMNSKSILRKIVTIIITCLATVLAIVLFLGLIDYFRVSKNGMNTQGKILKAGDISSKMYGKIKEIKVPDVIVVSGTVLPTTIGAKPINKTIEFVVTPLTVFKRIVLILPTKGSKDTNPILREEIGSMSDFKVNMPIRFIESDGDLLSTSKANLKTIGYDSF